MVLLELFGGSKDSVWWVGASSLGLCDRLTLLFRQSGLNYRTQRSKRAGRTLFTTYFQPLATTFGSYRPETPGAQARLLEVWQDLTEKAYIDKFICVTIPQKETLEYCLEKFGATYRTIDRPIVWKGNYRLGYFISTDW